MKITEIECRVLLVRDACKDITGIGESDMNPYIFRAYIVALSTRHVTLLPRILAGE